MKRLITIGAVVLIALGLAACGPKELATMGTDNHSFGWRVGCTIANDESGANPDLRPVEGDFQVSITNNNSYENVYRVEWQANDGMDGVEAIDLTGDVAANSTSSLLTLFPSPEQGTRVNIRMIRQNGAVVNKVVGFYDPVDYCYNEAVEIENYFANGNSILWGVGCQAEEPGEFLTATITNRNTNAAAYSIGAGTPYARSLVVDGQGTGIESPTQTVSWSPVPPPQGTVLNVRASNGTIVSTYTVDYCASVLPPA